MGQNTAAAEGDNSQQRKKILSDSLSWRTFMVSGEGNVVLQCYTVVIEDDNVV